MAHWWIRIQYLANMGGLILTAIGIFLVGLQINSLLIMIVGVLAFIPFLIIFSAHLGLLIADLIKDYPTLKRRILGIRIL